MQYCNWNEDIVKHIIMTILNVVGFFFCPIIVRTLMLCWWLTGCSQYAANDFDQSLSNTFLVITYSYHGNLFFRTVISKLPTPKWWSSVYQWSWYCFLLVDESKSSFLYIFGAIDHVFFRDFGIILNVN